MNDEVKVIDPKNQNGVRSTIVVSNTDLVTTMVVKLMKSLKTELTTLKARSEELAEQILVSPTQKAIDIAKIIVDTDVNLIAWKNLVTSLNPNVKFDIVLRESDIELYISRCISSMKLDEGEVKFEITTLSFDFDIKDERRNLPYFYNVKVGDLRVNEFPVDISFKLNVDKTELNELKRKISEIQSKINNRQAIQDEATAKITEASIAQNPDLQFLANIEIEPTNLLGY
jgi:hypothetical protein